MRSFTTRRLDFNADELIEDELNRIAYDELAAEACYDAACALCDDLDPVYRFARALTAEGAK
jgi:hypothetical protein